MEDVREVVRTFLLKNFLPGEPPDALHDDADLQEYGVLDSLGMLKLVSFLEDRFSVDFWPEDLDTGLSTVQGIERLTKAKMESRT
jgi:acyl carrier protein